MLFCVHYSRKNASIIRQGLSETVTRTFQGRHKIHDNLEKIAVGADQFASVPFVIIIHDHT